MLQSFLENILDNVVYAKTLGDKDVVEECFKMLII
jgi:hypothetical protein